MIPGEAAYMTQALPLADVVNPAVGKEGDKVLETKSVTTQLQPDTHSGFETKVATPAFQQAAQRSADAGQAAVDAATAAAQGAPAAVVAAQPAPTVAAAPTPAPSGQGLTGGIPLADTRPAQEEANRAALAAKAKEQADAEAAERQRVAAIAQQRQDQALARYAQAEKEYTSTKTPKTLKEEKGWVLNVLGAIAAGMGAYGATKSGSPNFALQILDAEQKRYDERKRAEMDAAWQSYQMAHKGLTEADKDAFIDKQMGRYLAGQKAQLGQLEQAAKVALARFPDIQMKVIADAKAKQAELEDKKLATAKETGVKTVSGGSATRGQVEVSVGPAGTQGAGKAPTEFQGKRSEAATGLSGEIDTLNKNATNIPSAMKSMQDNLTKLSGDQATAEKGGAFNARAVTLGREYLGFPRSAYSGMSEGQQVTAQAVDAANEYVARAMSGAAIGGGFSSGEEARMRRAFSFTPDMSPALVKATISRLEKLQGIYESQAAGIQAGDVGAAKKLRSELLGLAGSSGGEPKAAKSETQPAPAPPAKKPTGKELANSLSEDDLAWAKKAKAMKPDDPAYEKAQGWLKSRGLK